MAIDLQFLHGQGLSGIGVSSARHPPICSNTRIPQLDTGTAVGMKMSMSPVDR